MYSMIGIFVVIFLDLWPITTLCFDMRIYLFILIGMEPWMHG